MSGQLTLVEANLSRRNVTRRTEIRDKFGIKGSRISDCCASYWCPCCSLVQQDNEVKARLGYETLREGYQVNIHMEIPQMDVSPAIEASTGGNLPSNMHMMGEN